MSVGKRSVAYVVLAVAVAAVVIAGAMFAPSLISKPTTTQKGYALFLVQLTDPPQVPVGTEWLNVTYTNVEVHIEGVPHSGWISANTSGTVDLLALINLKQTIAKLSLPNGSDVNQIRLDVSSAKIKVNGTVYNVTLASNRLEVPIVGQNKVENLSAALLQLSPKVFEIQTGNNTAPIFVLVPSATAVLVPPTQVTQNQTQVGAKTQLSGEEEQELEEAQGSLQITAVSLSVSGNVTTFSITLKNTGKVPVTVSAISIHGEFNVSVSPVCGKQGEENQSGENGDHGENVSTPAQENSSDSQPNGASGMEDHHKMCVEHELEHPDEVVFFPISNTTLTHINVEDVQGNDDNQSNEQQPAYTLVIQPNESVTLTFKGVITFGKAVSIVPIVGNSYEVHVEASTENVTRTEVTAS